MAKQTFLRIGNRGAVPASSLDEAQNLYRALRDQSGEGASTFPNGRFGRFHISYNGRAWRRVFDKTTRLHTDILVAE